MQEIIGPIYNKVLGGHLLLHNLVHIAPRGKFMAIYSIRIPLRVGDVIRKTPGISLDSDTRTLI